jgi:DNA replication and repair protein RecF
MRRIGVAFENGRLERRLDGQSGASGAELAAQLPVHVIDPGSHDLIQGAPSERRRFLDWGVFHVEHSYLDAWRRYRRVLSQRNSALKAGGRSAEIDTWSAALVAAGLEVHSRRERYVAELAVHCGNYGTSLLGATLALTYRPGWRADVSFEEALVEAAPRDRAMGTTEVGPHRADLAIRFDGRVAHDEASRGQQKLLAAALILAQVRVFEARQSDAGILLVDDPAAELDAVALDRLTAVLSSVRAQMLLTAITPHALPFSADSAVFHVERGVVHAL